MVVHRINYYLNGWYKRLLDNAKAQGVAYDYIEVRQFYSNFLIHLQQQGEDSPSMCRTDLWKEMFNSSYKILIYFLVHKLHLSSGIN